MAKKKSKAKSKTTLGKFFRDLHKKPDQLEKFSSGAAGRAEVIDKSNLKPEHKKLLKTGCVPDIIKALAGVPLASDGYTNTVVQCCDPVTCGHPHCEAFSKATAVTIAPKTTKKKKK